jgi:Na+/proline symporter
MWLAARATHDAIAESATRTAMLEAQTRADAIRAEAKAALSAADARAPTKDSDYVFITFILDYLPHGAIGLLVAVMIAAALGSKAGELNALGTTTTIDLWRHFRPLAVHDEARNVRAAKWFTAFWGFVAIGFALFASFAENLIEAINIIGSIFYGVVLGIFLVAFFLKRVGGTAVFWSALVSQTLIFVLFFHFGNRVAYLYEFNFTTPAGRK